MKKQIMISALVMVFLISLVSAQQVYPAETEVDLKVPCYNNNTYCTSSSVCNLTVITFDGTLLLNNVLMTQNTAYHNYTLNVSDTEKTGEYRASIVCDDGGVLGYSTFPYIITPTGKSTTVSSAIVQGLILFLMFGVTLFFLLFARTTETPGVKLFFNVISYITMLLTVGTAYILLQSSEIQSNVSTTVSGLLFIVAIVFVVIMFYIMINQTKHVLQLLQIKKGFGSGFDDPQMF